MIAQTPLPPNTPAPDAIRIAVVSGVNECSRIFETNILTIMALNYLHHPLVQSLGRVEFSVFDSFGQDTLEFSQIDELLAGKPSLIIFIHGESTRLDAQGFLKLQRYLADGGACILVQPQDAQGNLPETFQDFTGIRLDGWHGESARGSSVTGHPLARVLGVFPGELAYQHRHYWRSMRLCAQDAQVLSEFTGGHAADLLLSNRVRCAIFASDIFCDVFRTQRGPAYMTSHDRVGRLIANVARHLLGGQALEQPLAQAVVESEPYFFACGLARFTHAQICSLSGEEIGGEEQTAAMITQAARIALDGASHDPAALLEPVFKRLGGHIAKFNHVHSYLLRGWHGGLLFPHSGPEGMIGYAEWGWPDFTLDWMRHQMDLARRYGGKRLNEIPGQTWEVLRRFDNPIIGELKNAIKEGLVETVRGFWAHAYLESVGEESNIRQIAYGKELLEELFETKITSYLCPLDHYEYHPQLPQLLRAFGYERAFMSNWGYCGQLRKLDESFIGWKGKDGTVIPAIPSHSGSLTAKLLSNVLSLSAAKAKVGAQRAGMASIAIGGAQDATVDTVYEREQAIYNNLGNIESTCVTLKEYFELEKPPAAREHTFDLDDMRGHPEAWSGYGSIAELGRRDRRFESALLSVESLHALAVSQGAPPRADELRRCWHSLLTSQDHFVYGCGGAANCEAYDTSGLQYPHILNYAGPKIQIKQEDLVAQDLHEKGEQIRDIAQAAMGALAPAAAGDADGLLVFNSLAWSRRERVETTLEFSKGRFQSVGVQGGGEFVPCETTVLEAHPDGSAHRAKISFTADLPALGWRRFKLVETPARMVETQKFSIQNEHFIVEVNPQTGALSAVIHKASGRNLVQGNVGANVFEYEETQVVSSCHKRPEISVTATPARQTITVAGTIGKHPYRTEISLAHGIDRVDFNSQVDCGKGAIFGYKGQPDTLLKIRFPLSLCGRRIVHQPFGVYESKQSVQAVLDFSAIAEQDGPTVMISSLGIPGHRLGGSQIELLIGDGFPPVYGVQRFSYSLFCLENGQCSSAKMARRAREWMVAPLCTCARMEKDAPDFKSWLSIEEPFVPTAVLAEKGRLIARLYNCSDHAAPLMCADTLGLGRPVLKTLDGEPVADGQIGAWKIAQLEWKISQ